MNWYVDLVQQDPTPPAVKLPRRFVDATIKGVQEEGLQATARDYLRNFWDEAAQGIAPCFLGRSRTWKTYTAAAIAQVVSVKGRVDTEFVEFPSAVLWMEQNRFKDEMAHRLHRWYTVPFLVVDDFATASDNYAKKVLEALASERHGSQLPTLWTGNVRLGEGSSKYNGFVDKFGPLFTRRLLDGSKDYKVYLH